MMELIDRYLGALLGLATGDALGTTLEFASGDFEPVTMKSKRGQAYFLDHSYYEGFVLMFIRMAIDGEEPRLEVEGGLYHLIM